MRGCTRKKEHQKRERERDLQRKDKRKEQREATGSALASRDVACVRVEERGAMGWSKLRCRGGG